MTNPVSSMTIDYTQYQEGLTKYQVWLTKYQVLLTDYRVWLTPKPVCMTNAQTRRTKDDPIYCWKWNLENAQNFFSASKLHVPMADDASSMSDVSNISRFQNPNNCQGLYPGVIITVEERAALRIITFKSWHLISWDSPEENLPPPRHSPEPSCNRQNTLELYRLNFL